jgi:hypothetical protein
MFDLTTFSALHILAGYKNLFISFVNKNFCTWDKIAQELQVHPSILNFFKGNVSDWLRSFTRVPGKKQKRKAAGVILFFWWNIWKERVFEQKEQSLQVADIITQGRHFHV